MSIYKLGKIGGSTPTPPEVATIGGKQYPVVTIGSQKWLGANLDYKFSGCNFNPETWADGNPNCCYYGGGASEYKTGYGLLYNFYAVQLLETNKASLIPGWHVPTYNEILQLISTIGGADQAAKLRAKTGWTPNTGTDNYKFSALPSGRRDYDDGTFTDGFFQCASITEADLDNCESLFIQNDENVFDNWAYKLDGISIRLIKD